ncbi:hypothetical protein PFICI_03889 [Pestalotiopsis fici W106-1]|uniref:Zn(2)-C6 fungal-type domain-containing protein n=1 Tax=Pestalotiopsis fici (strain W106-1 / CGMCC3.15140) TaxID=1229662 RepID=W3XIN1_PESFW|nr:uncharacterized protein PFICI_03889 [Pestalotiopsis fici W106-1]ETS85864.1 hypothetical protein PFICI_03889 [Pestalotiopsis fici W106-1]
MDRNGARKPRSRRNRPCDFCRSRKVACKIEKEPPCQLCLDKSQECTFNEATKPRKRRHVGTEGAPGTTAGSSSAATIHPEAGIAADMGWSQYEDDNDMLTSFLQTFDLEQNLLPGPASFLRPGPHSASSASPGSGIGQSATGTSGSQDLEHPTVDPKSRHDWTSTAKRYVGPSGDLDPFLLAYRSYNTDNTSVSHFAAIEYHRTRPLNGADCEILPPAVFTMSRSISSTVSTSLTENTLRHSFEQKIDDITASGLVALFFRFVHPYQPIISRLQFPAEEEGVSLIPLGLLSAICATAIPFVLYDDALCVESSRLPTSSELYDIASDALARDLGNPSIVTLQTQLLLLHRHRDKQAPIGDASIWSQCGQMVSLAQILGLNDDSSSWTALTGWERRLRKRLWWAVWITEKWTALGQGMPSHISKATWTVPPLDRSDLIDDPGHNEEPSMYFKLLAELTIILNDIIEAFFTLNSTTRAMDDFGNSLQVARALRLRLKDWHNSLPETLQTEQQSGSWMMDDSSSPDLNGNASLGVAFFTAQLTIFRALMRPISMKRLHSAIAGLSMGSLNSSKITPQSVSATLDGAIVALESLIRFVGNFNTTEWDAFWPGWSKHNFALASTLLLQCCLITSPTDSWQANQTSAPQGADPDARSLGQLDANDRPLESSSGAQLSAVHARLQNLAQRWRWTLRLATRGAANNKGLIDSSLRRVDALLTEWRRAQSTHFEHPTWANRRDKT